MSSQNLSAVRNALTMLGRKSSDQKSSAVVPTAKARQAIDFLASNTAESLLEKETNLRTVAEGLFNWDGKPKVTKLVIRALNEALNTPGKYQHAVELSAFLSALSPFLEPDRIARLYKTLEQVDTVFAPARYTLQLSARLRKVFAEFPQERIERLAADLWVVSHKGRWWDITSGTTQAEQQLPDAAVPSRVNMLESFIEGNLPYHAGYTERFSTILHDERIVEKLAKYNDDFLEEKAIDPDIALYSSYIPWLDINERPESPVTSLIDNLIQIVELLDFKHPAKPKTFSELFPDVRLYGTIGFPFDPLILGTDSRLLLPNVTMELVRNATQLSENRDYMGNCTWSYKGKMEKGTYVLYRLLHEGNVYNAAMTSNRTGWRLQEINSRHNRGNVPANIRRAFEDFTKSLPAPIVNEETEKRREYERQLKNHKYTYALTN